MCEKDNQNYGILFYMERITDIVVGKTLRHLREEQGLRQSEVAERFEVSQPIVSKIESGERGFYLREIVDYASALGIQPDVLFSKVCHSLVKEAKAQRK